MIGLTHTSQLTVTEAVTAIAMGSGDMPVLATPAMMALMENAAMLAVADHLPEYHRGRTYRLVPPQAQQTGRHRDRHRYSDRR